MPTNIPHPFSHLAKISHPCHGCENKWLLSYVDEESRTGQIFCPACECRASLVDWDGGGWQWQELCDKCHETDLLLIDEMTDRLKKIIREQYGIEVGIDH